MHLIKVTSFTTNKPIYINIDAIGHIHEVETKNEYGKQIDGYTSIGVTTHNNGGFKVKESVDEVVKQINEVNKYIYIANLPLNK